MSQTESKLVPIYLLQSTRLDHGVRFHTRNVIEFKRYRKFEAEVRIAPD